MGGSQHHVVGREGELALADEFLAEIGRRFGVLVLEGEAGIGKTTVWREIIRRAGEAGIRVLSCRPGELETKLALSAVADLAESVPREEFARLPDPQQRVLEVALLRTEPAGRALEPREVATAFRSLLEVVGERGPLLVAVDDVQWLDAASATAIGFALRRLGHSPIGWLLAQRTGEASRLDVDRLVTPASLTRLTIGRLSFGALHEVLRVRLGRPLSRPTLARVHRACEGNVLHALEIGRELLREGDPAPGELAVPAGLRRLVVARVGRLPRTTREALLTCAALSDPTTALVDENALAPAEEEDIVAVDEDGRIAFRHPLFAWAVYGSSSRTRRRATHAQLADVVTDVEERARHRGLAAAEPDEEIARAVAEGAALARSRGAWESAAELLEQAARLTPSGRDGDDAHRRVIAAAEHHIHAGDRSRARRMLEAVVAQDPSRGLRGEALRLLAEVSYNDENLLETRRLFEEALGYCDGTDVGASVELGLAWVNSNLGEFTRAASHAHSALALAEDAGDRSLLGRALGYCAMMDLLCGRGADWEKIERSLAYEDADSLVPLQHRPSTLAGLLALFTNRHAEAREWLSAVYETARERGDESDAAFMLFWLSVVETRTGNLALAADLAEEAVALARLTGSASFEAWARAQRAYVGAHRGEEETSRRICEETEPLVAQFGHATLANWVAATRTLLELSAGDAEAAWAASEPLAGTVEQLGLGEPSTVLLLSDAIEALIELGEVERAEALLDELERAARRLDRVWALASGARCRGQLLARRGDLAAAAAAFDRALAAHEREDMPFERARTLLAKGLVDRRCRRRTQAKAAFEQSAEIFGRIGAVRWGERARAELGRVGLRRTPGDGLTETELRVADLAASGRTNREIAAALFISPKTVEANLSRVYRKLDIHSRAELGARRAEFLQT